MDGRLSSNDKLLISAQLLLQKFGFVSPEFKFEPVLNRNRVVVQYQTQLHIFVIINQTALHCSKQ